MLSVTLDFYELPLTVYPAAAYIPPHLLLCIKYLLLVCSYYCPASSATKYV